MKKILFSNIAALFLVLGALFVAPPIAQAAGIELPHQLSYAGLTFIQPLTFETPTKQIHVQTQTLTFSIPEKLAVAHTVADTTQVDTDIVLLPTITTAAPLPVLPSQTPPAAFQKEDPEETPTPTIKKTLTTAVIAASTKISSTIPTPSPSPTSAPVSVAPVATNTSTGGGLDAEKLFNMSNAFRQARGLPAFQKDARACSLAASRAPEISGEIAGGHMHSGLRARALPYWNSENIISMRTEEAAFNWWVNDKIHHDAIVGNYTYSCVACSGNSCAQEFTNFQPK